MKEVMDIIKEIFSKTMSYQMPELLMNPGMIGYMAPKDPISG